MNNDPCKVLGGATNQEEKMQNCSDDKNENFLKDSTFIDFYYKFLHNACCLPVLFLGLKDLMING